MKKPTSKIRRYSVPQPHPKEEELIQAVDRAWWLSFLASTVSERERILDAYSSMHDEVEVQWDV